MMDRQDHLNLQNKGIIVSANSIYRKGWDANYADFSFTTDNGQKINSTEKCHSEETFNEQYLNLKVIYSPNHPEEFQNLYDFKQYSWTYRVLFFFGFYLTFLTFFLYIMNRNIRGLYKFYKHYFSTSKSN